MKPVFISGIKICSFVLLMFVDFAMSAKPMESILDYNVILVHGAADSHQGLDCENGDYNHNNEVYQEAYEYRKDTLFNSDTVTIPYKIGGIKYTNSIGKGKEGGSALGMIKELAPLLRDTILETPLSLYFERPFVNPAESPAHNAIEIGSSKWMGSNKCSARRSLIEEAKEFKAKGQDTLLSYRNSVNDGFRSKAVPSRNILIGHSMGGVAIREYIQGDSDLYNDDVDKAIMLDSPHEGTVNLPDVILFVRIGDSIEIHRVWRRG